MAVSLCTIRAGLYPQEDSWYSFFLEAERTPGAEVPLEKLSQLKYPVTSSIIEPAIFCFAA
jgi:hypothetical protein